MVGLCAALFSVPCSGGTITIHATRKIDTLGRGGPSGPDTLGVRLRYFAEGTYDTIWEVDTTYDTTRIPLDIVLAIDLSTSMSLIDSAIDSKKRARILWAKLAALHFLDSLKAGDRVSVMGWTAVGTPSGLADTGKPSRYFHKWCEFTSDFSGVRAFIRDSLFIDSTRRIVDTCEGQTLVVRDNIPNGQFTSTPLHISTCVTATHLANVGRPDATKAVIMLTDGANNDLLLRSVPVALLDSLKRTKNTYFHAIGFISGDTTELQALAMAGGGRCYNAEKPGQLDSIYAGLAGLLVNRRIDTTVSLRRIVMRPDTVRMPVDVLLAIDLSTSMLSTDGTARMRIAWEKIAALGFLDSLKPQDRVAVLGWVGTSSGNVRFGDTLNSSLYFSKWCGFTSDLAYVRSFIRDSLYIDGSFATDTFGGIPLVLTNDIPNGSFSSTPLHVTTVLAMSRLSSYSRPWANRVTIMLSDGGNNDYEPLSAAVAFVDSLRRTSGLLMHTIGFVTGDTAELHALAMAGGGNYYEAKNYSDLQSAYASLAHQLVTEKLAARKLTIQEVLQSPPLYFIPGTQKATVNSTVPLESIENFTDIRGNTVLRWYFKTIRVWGVAEVYYKVIASQGFANTLIGLDSAHANGGFYSQMAYTDDAYTAIVINLPCSGTTPIAYSGKGGKPLPLSVSFRPDGVLQIHATGSSPITLTLFTLAGRQVFRATARPALPGAGVRFPLARVLPPGVYAACLTYDNTTTRTTVRSVR